MPIVLDEVAEAFKLSPSALMRKVKELVERGLARPRYTQPEQYLSRIVSKLNLTDEQRASLIREAAELIRNAREHNEVSGLSRLSVAAAAIYTVAKRLHIRITQDVVASAAGVSAVTLRAAAKRFKRLKQLTLEAFITRVKPSKQELTIPRGGG